MLTELHNMKDADIRSSCKEKIESLEHWLRRLIEDTLTPVYGDYFEYTDEKGNRLISTKLAQQVEDRRSKEPSRYPRKIDAVLLDDAIAIICKHELFKQHFGKALKYAFPDGAEEARTFLSRLNEPRNNLAHANPISTRQAEQIICYANDVIESLKKYYSDLGMQQEYNVPLILKFIDSFGNVRSRNQFNEHVGYGLLYFTEDPRFVLRPGDILTVEIEVDPSFNQEEYQIEWTQNKHSDPLNRSSVNTIPITVKEVGEMFCVTCNIISKKEWHRLSCGRDDELNVYYKVLPPLE